VKPNLNAPRLQQVANRPCEITAAETEVAQILRILWAGKQTGTGKETVMVIYLDEYRKVKAAKIVATRQRYDEERMCVNWNPAFQTLATFCYQPPHELSPQLPDDFTAIDVDAFVARVHALATQI
jgi:hypothetical protein